MVNLDTNYKEGKVVAYLQRVGYRGQSAEMRVGTILSVAPCPASVDGSVFNLTIGSDRGAKITRLSTAVVIVAVDNSNQ